MKYTYTLAGNRPATLYTTSDNRVMLLIKGVLDLGLTTAKDATDCFTLVPEIMTYKEFEDISNQPQGSLATMMLQAKLDQSSTSVQITGTEEELLKTQENNEVNVGFREIRKLMFHKNSI